MSKVLDVNDAAGIQFTCLSGGKIVDPFHDRTIVVTHCGRICLGKKKINFSTVFAGQAVGIKEVQDGIWLVSFMDYDLGYFDLGDAPQYEGGICWHTLVRYTRTVANNQFTFTRVNTGFPHHQIPLVFVANVARRNSRQSLNVSRESLIWSYQAEMGWRGLRSGKLEPLKPQCLPVKRQRAGTTSSGS